MIFEEIKAAFNKAPFVDRISICRSSYLISGEHECFPLQYDGYVTIKSDMAVECSSGCYYVYLWKHMFGDVFYVGEGHGDRCKVISNRPDSFYNHIDKGDAVVYVILRGVNRDTARFYERYLSICLGLAGSSLANRDNSVVRIGSERARAWLSDNESSIERDLTKCVEEALLNRILGDTKFSGRDVLKTIRFVEHYGDSYFSTKYSSAARELLS